MDAKTIFEHMPSRYRKGSAKSPRTYYFSIGDLKYTLRVTPEEAVVEPGKTLDNADVVLKATPELFIRMVVHGKLPGPIDIAMGRIKTNDPGGLQALREMFDLSM